MNLWKYLLLLSKEIKKEDQGFTIPLVLGFGLFMLLTGIAAIKFGSTSEVNSKVQEKNLQAVAAAEMGLARLQNLINENRAIAVYNDCVERDPQDTDGDGEPDSFPCKSGSGPSWANATLITQPASERTSCNLLDNEAESEIISIAANTAQWQEADPTNPKNGQFRLIRYTYTSAANSGNPYDTPGIAELVVEGRTDQLESGATDDGTDTYNTGRARLSIEIPVTLNTQQFLESVPGLWMKFDVFATMSDNGKHQKVNGSILVEDADCSGGGEAPTGITDDNIAKDASGEPTGDVKASPIGMPDTPDLPPDNKLNIVQSYEIFDKSDSLPRKDASGNITDIKNSDGAYHYLVPNLEHSGGAGIKISTGERVVLYVQGNIELNGSINDAIPPQNLQIYGNTVASPGRNNSGYKYGCDNIVAKNGQVGTNSCPTTVLHLGGTADLNAFVHAPDAWACINGGGSDASITGALWINQWTSVVRTGTPADLTPCTVKDSTVIDFTAVNFPPNSILSTQNPVTISEPQASTSTKWERVSRDYN